MSIVNNVNEASRRVRMKLYPNCLPHVEGAYIARASLRNLANRIVVDVEGGLVDATGYIDEFLDIDSCAVNDVLTPWRTDCSVL
jgi:hypothetical protein